MQATFEYKNEETLDLKATIFLSALLLSRKMTWIALNYKDVGSTPLRTKVRNFHISFALNSQEIKTILRIEIIHRKYKFVMLLAIE